MAVKCSYDYDNYSIIMQDTNGQKHNLTGIMHEGSSTIDVINPSTVINALKHPGEVKFHITYNEYTISTYQFAVDTSNFKVLYESKDW